MITKSYLKVYRTLPDPDYFFIKNEYNGNNTIAFDFTSSVFTSANTEYRIGEDGEWTAFVFGSSQNVTLPANTKLYLRGTDWVRKDNSASKTISPSQNVSLGGCIMSLIDYQYIDSLTAIPNDAFSYIISNKVLRADFNFGNVTSISNGGCANMFFDCTSLTTAPDMANVTSIGSNGCRQMFNGCTSLTTAPDMANVTSIGRNGCYYMFEGCTKLTTAPDFSSLTNVNADSFDSCFAGCTSLTTSPNFSKVNDFGGSGYQRSFQSCFSDCTSLNYVYAPSPSTWDENRYFPNWLKNVASYGIVRKKSSLTIPSGTSGVPSGWDVENY